MIAASIVQLNELKEKTYGYWVDLIRRNSAVLQPETFKPEVRTYGDLRKKATWQKAYASFKAQSIWWSGITEHTAIVYVFNFSPCDENYELRHQILGEFLAIPGAMEFIICGIEEIYQSSDKSEQECANEFLEMVGGRSRRAREFAECKKLSSSAASIWT